jgi:hypothetical protein
MAKIDVPKKLIDGNLSYTEFNQFIEALSTGEKDIETGHIDADSLTVIGNVLFPGDVTIDGRQGPFSKDYSLENVAFVSKNGGTYGDVDGTSIGRSISSFTNALENIESINGGVPSYTNPIVLVCLDAGIYEEDLVVPDFVSIYAPTARLKLGGAGSRQLSMGTSRVTFHRIFRDDGSNTMITMTPSSIGSLIQADHIINGGSGIAIIGGSDVCSVIDVKVLELTGDGAIGISDFGSSNKHIHVHLSSLRMYSDNSIGIQVLNNSDIHGYIDDIHSNNQVVTGATAFDVQNGTVRMGVNRVDVNNFYSVVSPGVLNLFGNEFNGATSGNGTVNTITPDKFSNVDNTSDADKPISEATSIALADKADEDHNHDDSYEPVNANIQTHIADTDNPHGVTKADVGLGNVLDYNPWDMPISTDVSTALGGKSDTGHGHTQLDSLNIGNVGTGDYLEVSNQGKTVFKGAATVWNDIYATMTGDRLYANMTGDATFSWEENLFVFSPNGDITNTVDRVGSNVQMPHSIKLDSIVKLHMHWRQTDNTPREFTIRWRVQENDAEANNAWNTVVVNTSTNNVFGYDSGIYNQITRLVDIDYSPYKISDIIQFQVARTDSVPGDIFVSFFDLHYEIDTAGSDLEYTK